MKKKLWISLITFMLMLMCCQICAFAADEETTVPVESISFKKTTFDVNCGDEIDIFDNLSFTFTQGNEDYTVESGDIVYSFSREDICKVNSSYIYYDDTKRDILYAVTAGTCEVTASVNGHQAKCTVNVSHCYCDHIFESEDHHIYSDDYKAATISESGERIYYCKGTECSSKYTEIIPKLVREDYEAPVIDLTSIKFASTEVAFDDSSSRSYKNINITISISDVGTGVAPGSIRVGLFNVAHPDYGYSRNHIIKLYYNCNKKIYEGSLYADRDDFCNGKWQIGMLNACDCEGNYTIIMDKAAPKYRFLVSDSYVYDLDDCELKDLSSYSFTVTGAEDVVEEETDETGDHTSPAADFSTFTIYKDNTICEKFVPGDTVNLTLKVTDEESGPDHVSSRFEIYENGWYDLPFEMTYDETSGLMKGSLTIPTDAKCGTWFLDDIYVCDKAGNSREYLEGHAFSSISFLVRPSATDDTPPEINIDSLSVTPPTVDSEGNLSNMVLSVEVTDDETGVQSVKAVYKVDYYDDHEIGIGLNASENANVYEGSRSLEGYYSGDWKLYSIEAVDINYNDVVIYNSELEDGSDGKIVADLSRGDFNNSDLSYGWTYYTLDSISLDNSSGSYVYGDTAKLQIKVNASEQAGEVGEIDVIYSKPDGIHKFFISTYLSGDITYDSASGCYCSDLVMELCGDKDIDQLGNYSLREIRIYDNFHDDYGHFEPNLKTVIKQGLSAGDFTVCYNGINDLKFDQTEVNKNCDDNMYMSDYLSVSLKGREDNWIDYDEDDYYVPHITFTSSDEKVATVSSTGYVEFVDEGTCTISASTDTGEKASITLHLSHKWRNIVVTKEATATEDGQCRYRCILCKRTKTEVIKATGKDVTETEEKETQKETQKETSKETSIESEKESSRETSIESEKESSKETSIESEKETTAQDQQADKASESAKVTTKKILATKNEKDLTGSEFAALHAKLANAKKTSLKISWNNVKGASRYIVFGNKCGKAYKKLATVKKTVYTDSKLKKGTYYKYIVVAVDKNGQTLSTSKNVIAATLGGKNTNAAKVTTAAKKNKVSIKTGKTFSLEAKQVKKAKKLKLKTYRKLSYESDNTAVATVSAKGKIKGISKGTCNVYLYAQDGTYTKIKVTVK